LFYMLGHPVEGKPIILEARGVEYITEFAHSAPPLELLRKRFVPRPSIKKGECAQPPGEIHLLLARDQPHVMPRVFSRSREEGDNLFLMNSVLYPGQFVMGEAKPCLRRAKKEEKADMDKKAMVKAFKEKAAKEKAAKEKAAKEKAAEEKAAKEKVAKEKVAKEKVAKEKAAKEKAALEKAAVEKATMEKAAIDKAAMEAATDRAAMDKVALDRAAMEKASAKDKANSELATKEKARSKDSGAQTIGINATDSVEQPTVPESTVFSCQALNPGPGMIILEPVTVEQKVIFGMLATVGLIKNVSDSAHLGSRGHFAFVPPGPRENSKWLLTGNDGRPPVSVGPSLDSRCFSGSVTTPESKGVDAISSSAKRMKPDPEYDLTIASVISDKDGLNNFSYSTQ
jgi:hypothetical protein